MRKKNFIMSEFKFKNMIIEIKKKYFVVDSLLLVFKVSYVFYLIIPLMCILLGIHSENNNLIRLDIAYCISMIILFMIFFALGKHKIKRNFIFYAGFLVFIFFVEVMQNNFFMILFLDRVVKK